MNAPSEADFLRQVVQLARLRHWLVAHFRTGRTARGGWVTPVQGDGAGWPDLFLCRPATGELLVAELKSDRGRLTPEQRAWLDALRGAGLPVKVWRPSDWDEIVRTLE